MKESLPIPVDSDGYTKSFTNPEDPEVACFFEKYGFVVISDALTENSCEKSLDELWTYIESEGWRRPGEPCFFGTLVSEVR